MAGMPPASMPPDDRDHAEEDDYRRAEFDAYVRSFGAVIHPLPHEPAAAARRNGNGTGRKQRAVSPEYRQMVRDAKAFFGADIQARLTEMLAPYRVTDTHDLTPEQCAEISEKIEILQALAVGQAP